MPFYSTTAPSTINVYGEGAMLKPAMLLKLVEVVMGYIY
jgi:hypothetical protein